MSINPKSVEFHQCHAKPHSICFFRNIKDNERNLYQDLLTIENIDSDLKVHALHYANELLVRVRLSFQKRLQNRSTYRNKTKKNVCEKSNDAYSLSIRIQTHISIFMFLCSLTTISTSKKLLSFSVSCKRHCPHTLTRAAWLRPSNFWLFRWVQPLYGAERKESSGTGLGNAPKHSSENSSKNCLACLFWLFFTHNRWEIV